MAFGQLREKRKTIFIDRSVLPQTVAVVKTRAEPFGIKVVVGNVRKLISEDMGDAKQHKDLIGVILQVSAPTGNVTVASRLLVLIQLVCSTPTFAARWLTGRRSPNARTTSAATSCALPTSSP